MLVRSCLQLCRGMPFNIIMSIQGEVPTPSLLGPGTYKTRSWRAPARPGGVHQMYIGRFDAIFLEIPCIHFVLRDGMISRRDLFAVPTLLSPMASLEASSATTPSPRRVPYLVSMRTCASHVFCATIQADVRRIGSSMNVPYCKHH